MLLGGGCEPQERKRYAKTCIRGVERSECREEVGGHRGLEDFGLGNGQPGFGAWCVRLAVGTRWRGVTRPVDTKKTGPRGRLQVLDQRDATMGLCYR